MQKIDLNTFANGAMQEKFDIALENVLKNLHDPNTSFKVKRGITIDIGFTQNEVRDDAKVSISIKTKIAPVIPIETSIGMGKDLQTGNIEIQEYGKQIKGQINIDEMDIPGHTKKVAGQMKGYDPSTGEIFDPEDDNSDNVVNLRNARI